MTISLRYRYGVNSKGYISQNNQPKSQTSRMRCSPKSLAFIALFTLLLVGILYGLFGTLSPEGNPVSITAIFQNVASSGSDNNKLNKVADNGKVKDVPTTTVATTTTESDQSKLLFKTEYNRISNNLQNGLQADDEFFEDFVPQHGNVQDKDISLQHLGVVNVQQLSNILQNSEIDSETGQHLVNVVPKDMQIRLQSVDNVGHRPIPSLHVQKVSDVSHLIQPKIHFANSGGTGGMAVGNSGGTGRMAVGNSGGTGRMAVGNHNIHPMFKFAHHQNLHHQVHHKNLRY